MTIVERLERVRDQIEAACQGAGRRASEITLVAVSKVQPAEAIREAYAAGHRHFGESYVQELVAKRAALSDLADIKWHFIGHLQRNKVRHVIGHTHLLETVDSLRLLEECQKRASHDCSKLRVLVQVNTAQETTKSGCLPEDLAPLLETARGLDAIEIQGLMAVPPYEPDKQASRHHFQALRDLGDRHLADTARPAPPELSMGMSHDFDVAIEEGATIVRVGTAIFGPRK